MNRARKGLTLFLILIIAASSMLLLKPITAQSMPKPSVPEFSLKYTDYSYSYSVPPTFGTDQYTGQNITINSGYTVNIVNKTVQFTIKNQPFTGYYDSNGNTQLYYHIKYKGSFGDTWSDIPLKEDDSTRFQDSLVFPASNSSYTVVSIYDYSYGGEIPNSIRLSNIYLPAQGKIDFEVQALIGQATLGFTGPIGDLAQYYYDFTGQTGDWSNPQTLSLPDGAVLTSASTNPTPLSSINTASSPTPTPSAPELSQFAILPLLLVALLIAVAAKTKAKGTSKVLP